MSSDQAREKAVVPQLPPAGSPPSKPRRELRRADLALRGLVVLVAASVLLGLAYARTNGIVGGDPRVVAEVRNAGGALRPGSDVKIAGVIVGRVTDITRAVDGNVAVELAVPEENLDQVPANVVARILPATVFGTTFVDLVVYGQAASQRLAADAVIPPDEQQDTLELQQALDDIDRLVTALGPAELQSAISSAATALQGRGEQIGELIDDADAYLVKVTPQLPLVRRDLRQLADNLEIVDRVAPDLLQATDDGLVTLDTIVTQRAAITAILTGGTTLADAAETLLDDITPDLVRTLRAGAVVLDAVYDNRTVGITDSISTNIGVAGVLPTVIREGFARIDARLVTTPPGLYTAADRPTYGRAMLRGMAPTTSEGAR